MQKTRYLEKSSPLGLSHPLPTVNSYNEWDPLEEVIVGCVEGAAVPGSEPAVDVDIPSQYREFFQTYGGRSFPDDLIQAASRELEELCHVLEMEGITVKRPDPIDFTQPYQTPDFAVTSGMYATMPRDVLTVLGDEVIEAPMAWRSRFFEYRAYRSLMKEYLYRGAKWTAAPKPLMADALYNAEYVAQPAAARYALTEAGQQYVTTEFEPCFDAADITRCGRDIFMQRSQVTNRLGILWLKRHLGDRFRVHELTFQDPNPVHIDATLVPLRPGLALINPERPCNQWEIFKRAGWDLVEAAPATIPADWKMPIATKWLSMNILILDPNRALVEKQEEPMQQLLKDLGFEVITLDFRNVYSFGGSFHCVTCDIRRRGHLEEYGFGEPDELNGWKVQPLPLTDNPRAIKGEIDEDRTG